MAETPYKGYALYEPDASPDLTESGKYNTALMAVDADMHDEEQARIEGDTALGKRIDNAEVEISANSADLTGIKGLTYGDTHVNFLENSNGEYSSPALEEIAEQVDELKAVPPYTLPVASSNTLGGVKIPSGAEIGINDDGAIFLAKNIPDKIQVQHRPGSTGPTDYVDLSLETGALEFEGAAFSLKAGDYGSAIVGLNLPNSGITANTTWGEIESAATQS
jgi:hypothetical protein|nr:MAG TPA_asm: hypothetical protein [Caudoviricetes sp.]